MRVKPGGKKSAKYRSSLVGTNESNSKWYLDWFSLGFVELCAKILQIMRNDFKD